MVWLLCFPFLTGGVAVLVGGLGAVSVAEGLGLGAGEVGRGGVGVSGGVLGGGEAEGEEEEGGDLGVHFDGLWRGWWGRGSGRSSLGGDFGASLEFDRV